MKEIKLIAKIAVVITCIVASCFLVKAYHQWYEGNMLNMRIGAALEDNKMTALHGNVGVIKTEELTVLYTEPDKSDSYFFYVFGENNEGSDVLMRVPVVHKSEVVLGQRRTFAHAVSHEEGRTGIPF